jgi:hypothetical protein
MAGAGANWMNAQTNANKIPIEAYQVMNGGGPATANALAGTYGLRNPTTTGSWGGMAVPSWDQAGSAGMGMAGKGAYGPVRTGYGTGWF